MKKCEFFVNFYVDKNLDRQREIEICLDNNLLSGYDRITLIVEQQDYEYTAAIIRNSNRKCDVVVAVSDRRPVFQDYFDLMDVDPEILNFWSNSDIFIESKELDKLKSLPWDQNLGVCLSRWDLTTEGAFLLDRQDSADFWAVKGPCSIKNFSCSNGPGVDNRLAWELNNAGYKVVNPSRDIATYHLHLQGGNNYREGNKPDGAVIQSTICPEPYMLHPPIFIKQI